MEVILQPEEDCIDQPTSQQMYTIRQILDSDLSEDLVMSICGILLPKQPGSKQVILFSLESVRIIFQTPSVVQNPEHTLVPVATTLRCLRSLAMAVVANRPALLEGPVGSGKTSLVEHLASQLGIGKPPGLIKIQLGDQTDSKVVFWTILINIMVHAFCLAGSPGHIQVYRSSR